MMSKPPVRITFCLSDHVMYIVLPETSNPSELRYALRGLCGRISPSRMKLIECVTSKEQESLSAAYTPFWMLTGCFGEIPRGTELSVAPFPLPSPPRVEPFTRLLRLVGGSFPLDSLPSLPEMRLSSLRLVFDVVRKVDVRVVSDVELSLV